MLGYGGDHGVNRRLVRHISGEGGGVGSEFGGDGFDLLGVDVVHGNLGAAGQQALGGGAAHAASGSGYQCDTALELSGHLGVLLW